MNEMERIQKKIEQTRSLIATIETNMSQIPEENRNSQMVLLRLEKNQLTILEQIAAN